MALLLVPLWLWVVVSVWILFMAQIDLFKNYSYSIGMCAKKNLKQHKKRKYECNSPSSKHKITIDGWYGVKKKTQPTNQFVFKNISLNHYKSIR